MQRDQKVGLALGVLLIGVVAAFFFRNEPEPGRSAPSLENAAEVDREISEKRLTPYFSEIKTDEPARGIPARTTASSRDQNDHRTGERKLPRWIEALKDAEHDPFAANSAGNHVPAPAPDPIQYEAATADPVAPSPTESNLARKPADGGPATVDGNALNNSAAHIHEVQKGETLSSIAGKHLGSQSRFHEIFAANRELLQDANDLKIGMKLRIPDASAKPAVGRLPQLPGTRSKKTQEPKPVLAPPLDDVDDVPPAAEIEAVTIGESATENDDLAESEPPETVAAEPAKIKFTPAKRRPARSGQ